MKNVGVITGTRAEYGLLKLLLNELKNSKKINLQLLVTGSHLSPKYGSTYTEIEADGFLIDRKIHILDDSETDALGLSRAVGRAINGFAEAFSALNLDIVVLVGDRYEILAAAIAAMMASIPIAHIHGGEVTEGAIDEAIRHSITKMSHLHFVATQEYKKRVLQLGENSKFVFDVGGLGVDSIMNIKLLTKNKLENEMGFQFGKRNLMVTFHPATLEMDQAEYQISELIYALSELRETKIIFTMPNADLYSDMIRKKINQFAANNANVKSYESLGQLRYLSIIPHVDAVVGNSSSGLLEVPSFKKATINIGSRQNGRLRARSVIDCRNNRESILEALKLVYSDGFKKILEDTVNPYGSGGASKKISQLLEDINLDGILFKKFNDSSMG